MLKTVSCAALIALAATAASAADLPLKAPVATPVAFTWTGCYVGGHLGVAATQDRTTSATGDSLDFSATGFVGGGQIGCDYQFASNWVIGAEGRAAWTSLSNTHAASIGIAVPGVGVVRVPSQFHAANDFLASATARLGYAVAPRWLVYARGGAAWTNEEVDDAFTGLVGFPTDPGATAHRSGWTAGGGVEWAFAPHWSANVEYNYYDFGTQGLLLTSPFNAVSVNALRDIIHTGTIGVNYRF